MDPTASGQTVASHRSCNVTCRAITPLDVQTLDTDLLRILFCLFEVIGI